MAKMTTNDVAVAWLGKYMLTQSLRGWDSYAVPGGAERTSDELRALARERGWPFRLGTVTFRYRVPERSDDK